MRRYEKELGELALQVVVVTFEARKLAEAYVRETDLPWPLLIDRSRALYSAYGMGRGRWSDVWGPASWWAYVRLIARGHRLRGAIGDVRQLGGDILVDPIGRVALHHVGHGPADRPAVSALLDRVRQG